MRAGPKLVLIAVVTTVAPSLSLSARAGASSASSAQPLRPQRVTASSTADGYSVRGPIDGDRFAVANENLWKGASGAVSWYWQADFGEVVTIGSLLQILGHDPTVMSAAPLDYSWQISLDGHVWHDLEDARSPSEYRMYRIHRLRSPERARYLRLFVATSGDGPPALRELEVYAATDAVIEFPVWILSVNSYESPSTAECQQFLELARKCDGWGGLLGQFVWHGYVDLDMALAEPRPLCAFYTGSFRDWCEVDRHTWRGTEQLLDDVTLPMWGSCGGAQAFGILAEAGTAHPWDCPKCRDPHCPRLPIYGHIGLIDPSRKTACGDYSNNLFERGPTPVRQVRPDPVFRGLPEVFEVPESHCGQLEFVPQGWELIASGVDDGKTWMQCMRRQDACIYAAQFHMELPGTPEVSRRIMANFLNAAQQWSAEGDHRSQ